MHKGDSMSTFFIQFPNREDLDRCFASEEYRTIMDLRMQSAEGRALIIEGIEDGLYAR